MTFDIALEIFHWHFILKTENIGAANLKTKTILCSLDVSCILQLARWSEIKFKKIVLTLDEILKGVLFALLFTPILAGNTVLRSPRNNGRWGESFPIRENNFHIWQSKWTVCFL